MNAQRFLKPEALIEEVEKAWREDLRHHLAVTEAAQEVTKVATRIASDPSDAAHQDWKAAVWAREELTSSGVGSGGPSDEVGASTDELRKRLERIRESFRGKARTR